ncbi:type II toxin-antitoxin system death-on-curing family toxin [Nostoc sp. UHCC 0926]|uniref:type II toxin-antitoxin system death-on-curing family toxin n=1 Tax=unclassified Nostoc TaxID=2593658 RepID=UPI0023628E5E|nr:type II toxin-antitoxin system death-on-curing family toxin [Nostoc sp. UHCC 0926]WDD34136.1 type II toxin-antitoxin system death-on-curing family toxin [Nostoc sp. UHCC 0926]
MQHPNFLAKEDVIRIHDELVSETGESLNILNEGLLDSALYSPQATFGGEYLHPTIYEQASAYLFHIACNHAFEQGNKRTAFATMVTFLNVNDYDIEITEEEAEKLMVQVVTHEISKKELPAILKNYMTNLI